MTFAPFVSSALPPQAPPLLLTLQTLSFPTPLLISLVALHFPKPSLAALSNKYERGIPPLTPNGGAPPPSIGLPVCLAKLPDHQLPQQMLVLKSNDRESHGGAPHLVRIAKP